MRLSAPIRGLSVALLVAGCAPPPPPQVIAPAPQLSEAERRLAALEGCPPFGDIDLTALADTAWPEPASLLERHVEIRAARGASLPEVRPRILTHFSAHHHGRTEASLAAVRTADGLWTVTAVGESQGAFQDSPVEIMDRDWTLTAAASAEVDAILVDPCFYAEPARVLAYDLKRLDGGLYQVIGGGTSVIEVDTGTRRRIAMMHHGNWGRTGRLMSLIATAPR